MVPSITLFYAALLGLWLILLTARVIRFRHTLGVSLGHGDHAELEWRIRAQGNLTEYAPFALLLLALLELKGTPGWLLHGLGLLLLVGRLIHGWAFSFANGPMGARVAGMALTLTMIGVACIVALARAVFS